MLWKSEVMLSMIIIFFQSIDDHLQMFFITEEIGIWGIDEKCFDIMVFYVMGVGLLDIEKIFVRYVLLISPVPFPDIFLQTAYRRMQVNEQIRLQQLLMNDIK